MIIKEGLWRHVTLGSRPISDLELLLERGDLLDCFVVLVLHGFHICVELQFGETKVDQEACLRVFVIEEVGGLDVSVHNPVGSEMVDRFEHAPHVVLDLLHAHVVEVSQERLALLVPKDQ